MPRKKNKGGRPTVMTPHVISKLEHIFALDGTDKEACSFAGISHQTLYDYQALYPEFVERKEMLKENPFIKARQTIINALDNPQHAQWYMTRKKKKEFGDNIDVTSDGKPIPISNIFVNDIPTSNEHKEDSGTQEKD